MLTGEFTIAFAEGLHARPASELVKICQKSKSVIKVIKDTVKIDPRSILGIMSLGAVKEDTITIEIEGTDEEETYKKLKDFFEAK